MIKKILSAIPERLPKISLYALVALLPLWFLPFTQNTLGFQKQFLLIILVFLGIIAYLAKAAVLGEFTLRLNWTYLPMGILLLIMGISSLLSPWQYASFWGWPLDVTDNFITVLAFALLYFLMSNVVKNVKELFSLTSLFLLSGFLAGLFALLQAYQVFILPFNFAKIASFNTIGSLNGIAIFLAVLLPLFLISAFLSKGFPKILFWILSASLLVILALINFNGGWIVLAFELLILLTFGIWNMKKKKFGWVSLPMALLIIALFFIFFRLSIPASPQAQLEILPSSESEMNIIKKVFQEDKENIFFGSGPGTFVFNYTRFHLPEINQTAFWNVRFSSGASEFLDFLATKGILGLLSLFSLIVLTVIFSIRKLSKSEDSFQWMVNLGFLSSLAGITAAFFIYPANFILWTIFWLLASGAIITASDDKELKKISFVPSSMWAVASSFLFLTLLIFSLGLLFVQFQKYAAEVKYSQASKLASQGKTDQAVAKILSAINLNSSIDLYWRDLAQAYIVQAQEISASPNLAQDEKQRQSSLAVSNAISAAKQAVDLSPENIANWNVQGDIYRNLIGIPGAESFAIASFEKAAELEPSSPFFLTEIARVRILNSVNLTQEQKEQDLNSALEKLTKAIGLKPDYAPAHYLTAVIYDQQGKTDQAIAKLEETKLIAPSDTGLAFQLGVIYWQVKDIEKAKGEFERIKMIDGNHANARYMLGLVYDKAGQKEKAIEEFEKVLQLNPGNKEVEKILDNLAKGKEALSGIEPGQPPIEERPKEINE